MSKQNQLVQTTET